MLPRTCAIFAPSGNMLPDFSRTWFAIIPARLRPAPDVRVAVGATLAHTELQLGICQNGFPVSNYICRIAFVYIVPN